MTKRNGRNNKMRKFWITILFVVVSFSVCWALSKIPKQAFSLRGLEGVGVAIFLDGAEYCGLTGNELRAITELGLRRNGIKVLTARECGETIGKPHLDVHVTVAGEKNIDARAATVYIELKQDAYTLRSRLGPYTVSTWHKQYTLINSVTALDSQAKEAVNDCVDDFCNDYLLINPIEKPVQPKVDESEAQK
jgi:hypothetical protein